MRILILGSGGREYALCKALLGNTLFCIGKSLNPGLIDLSTSHYSSKNLTLEDIEKYILEWNIDYGIIGPEHLLNLGVADLFLKHNISCIGPLKSHARIETDKIYATLNCIFFLPFLIIIRMMSRKVKPTCIPYHVG